ncbi:hypothetical protein [Vibrio sp. Isolate24]|uniref:hypothetical protein n=1 Tax=Vibrio sp. Isolate24 TaxID=2908534 RepID=UPI001EFEEEAF|nr:hypothetical protein [Vibrio sp. Isolate24]MCG9679095.1 hypothetical protein [Vibrio sp. Isolate24]
MSRAFDAFGNIVSISDVPRGSSCNCTCIGCNSSLVARKGEERADHFAHDPNSKVKTDCSWAPETDIHLIVKEIIAEDKSLLLPIGTIEPKTEIVEFSNVQLEVKRGNRIPDVVAEVGGETFFIEVAVTHSCDGQKVQDYKQNNQNCLEIDLSGYRITGELVSKSELREIIHSAEANWLSVAPTGNYAEKINTHNRRKISELHKRHRRDKQKLQSELTKLKSNIQFLQEKERRVENQSGSAAKQLQQVNHKIKQARATLRDCESNIEHYDSMLQKVYMFEENQRQHASWHVAAVASNKKRENELDEINFKLSSWQSTLEDTTRELERQQLANDRQAALLKSKEVKLDLSIESRAMELAEARLDALLKSKQSQIDDYDARISDAEKRFAEVKRKYGSYIKV